MVCKYHTAFIHSAVSGHLGCALLFKHPAETQVQAIWPFTDYWALGLNVGVSGLEVGGGHGSPLVQYGYGGSWPCYCRRGPETRSYEQATGQDAGSKLCSGVGALALPSQGL